MGETETSSKWMGLGGSPAVRAGEEHTVVGICLTLVCASSWVQFLVLPSRRETEKT